MTLRPPPPSFNMAQYVLAKAVDLPSKTALEVLGETSGQQRLTYAELVTAVQSLAAQIAHQSPDHGARILLRLGNTPRFPIAYLAALAVDRVPIVTSAKLTQPEVETIASETKPSLVIADQGLAVPSGVPQLDACCTDGEFSGYTMGDPNRPAYIVYTSGTSGHPRAVVHAHRAVWARRSMMTDWYDLRPDDRILHAGAFNWTYTLGTGLMDPWTVGATALIPSEGTEAAALQNLIAQHRATLFAASPGIYRRMLRCDVPKMSTLRHGLTAGEKLPDVTRQKWESQTATKIHEAFGMSECSTFLSGSPNRPSPKGTLGFAQRGRLVTLRKGQIAIHRSDPGLMLGYLDQPAETARRYDGEWFLTGDTGKQNPDGSFTYQGRVDDMMNAGGHRVSPLEVEHALSSCAEISEVACAEVRLRADLSLIAAFYVAPNVIDEDKVKARLGDRLADYKQPRLFVRVDNLPRGNNNKLLRRKLKEDWEAEHGQT